MTKTSSRERVVVVDLNGNYHRSSYSHYQNQLPGACSSSSLGGGRANSCRHSENMLPGSTPPHKLEKKSIFVREFVHKSMQLRAPPKTGFRSAICMVKIINPCLNVATMGASRWSTITIDPCLWIGKLGRSAICIAKIINPCLNVTTMGRVVVVA